MSFTPPVVTLVGILTLDPLDQRRLRFDRVNDSRCRKHVYNAGDSLTESTQTHYVRNVDTVNNAHFMVTYVIAHGQPRRIDQPAPACAAALGLE